MTELAAAWRYVGGPLDGRHSVPDSTPYRKPDGTSESTTAGDDRLLRGRWQQGDCGLYVFAHGVYRSITAPGVRPDERADPQEPRRALGNTRRMP